MTKERPPTQVPPAIADAVGKHQETDFNNPDADEQSSGPSPGKSRGKRFDNDDTGKS